MTQTLEQLSAAATQGTFEALTPDVENNFGVPIIATDYPGTYGPSNGLVLWATMLPTEIDAKDIARARANAAFIVALVNLYRTGQLVAVQPDDATVERYRHKKRGTVYEVIGEAELQTNTDNLVDGSQMMVYRGEDGKLWCRHYDEFHDGRFAAAKGPKP